MPAKLAARLFRLKSSRVWYYFNIHDSIAKGKVQEAPGEDERIGGFWNEKQYTYIIDDHFINENQIFDSKQEGIFYRNRQIYKEIERIKKYLVIIKNELEDIC